MKNFSQLPATILLGFLLMAPGAQAQGDAEAGAEKAATCAACHGEDGNSPAPMYPKIAGLGEKYLYKQLEEIQSGVRPVPEMTGLLDGMSDQDLQDLAAYYSSQSMQLAGAEDIQVQLNSGDSVSGLALGEAVYRFGNAETGVPSCSACHSPSGQGNAPAGYPRLGGQFADYVAKQLRDFRAGDRVNDEQLVMREVAEHMSEAEIIAVANYIAGLHVADRNPSAP